MPDCDPGGSGDSSPRGPDFESDGGQSALDRILLALADEQRRHFCYHVTETEPTDIEEAAAAVAARELDCSPADVPEDRHQAVKLNLYHLHLPELADAGIVDYDERTGTIRYQHPPPHFEEFLQLAHRVETR